MERRSFLKTTAGGALAGIYTAMPKGAKAAEAWSGQPLALAGNINHSVCKWCYSDFTVEELAVAASRMGLASIELLDPADWPVVQKYGLTCALTNGPNTGHNPLTVGFNRIEHHEFLVPGYKERIVEAAEAGLKQVICFSGNREGLDDEQGLENCAKGVKAFIGTAEQHGITVCMELLNSRVNHPDYQCDKTPWGVALVDKVGSDNFKLLYDIYHMQIMEGDVIRTIRTYSDYFSHYHTGGNPGRNEIDETQELNYRAIMQAIVDTGFTGYVAQEFIPTRAPLMSLGQAISICDV